MPLSSPLTVGVLLAVLVGPATLAAQRATPDTYARFDVGLGVTMNTPVDVNQRPKCTELGLPCGSPRTFPDFGAVLQAAVQATRYLGFVAEAGIYDNSWDTVGVNKALTNHVSSILIGPRLGTGPRDLVFYKDTTRFRAFAQIIGGPEASMVLPTRFALQPGAGFDGKLSPAGAWLRITYDYRLTRGSPRNLSGSRVLCAFVLTTREGG